MSQRCLGSGVRTGPPRCQYFSTVRADVPPVIEYGASACGPYVADLPTVELTVRGASGEHRVRFDQGCRNHPYMLDTLANMVDSISGSSRWTTVTRP